MKTMNVTLTDQGEDRDTETPIEVRLEESGQISLKIEGYGSCDMEPGHGVPILIEMLDGVLRVIVWSDINDVDPTHVIEMEGARDSAYRDDPKPAWVIRNKQDLFYVCPEEATWTSTPDECDWIKNAFAATKLTEEEAKETCRTTGFPKDAEIVEVLLVLKE